jgi:hypothetical protein
MHARRAERRRRRRWRAWDPALLRRIGYDAPAAFDAGADGDAGAAGPSGDGAAAPTRDANGPIDDEARWRTGVRDYIRAGLKDGHSLPQIATEITCFKHSEHKEFVDCVAAALPVALDSVDRAEALRSGGTMALLKAFKDAVEFYAPLLEKFQSDAEPAVFIGAIYALEEYALSEERRAEVEAVFPFLLQFAWECDVTTSEAVLEWARQRREDADDEPEKVLFEQPRTQKFVESVRAEDEEDDSDEEGSEYESSDGE